ncbi:hypothetical protein BGZ96_008235 [Linnemannia gamsii]|uniref:SAP domain-containing protein n=1 Tax=Linnemannia gamsii TaxID=64522 RepID=A0ABQ7KD48_9FUNG|nr:hypothetical protein BGZ96_008235 [Linnemannia gamsii]
MSVVSLSRRRKAELKELASNLGLSEDGVREDIVERIKAHIATSNDPSLRALIREDSPDAGTTTATTTYTIKDNSASASGRSPPRKKTATVVTKESRSSASAGGGARRRSQSHSHTEDEELEERQVRGFMEHMQGELHGAKDLAEQLEETLHAKFATTVENVCQCTSKTFQRLQDLGSTSRGFVWLTLLLELTVFLSQAHAYSKVSFSRLSYFVFKFALTYFLGHSIGLKSLLGTALPAGAKIWSGCKYISDIFRYVPQSLGLAISGAGTVLALAESIVQSNHHRR